MVHRKERKGLNVGRGIKRKWNMEMKKLRGAGRYEHIGADLVIEAVVTVLSQMRNKSWIARDL